MSRVLIRSLLLGLALPLAGCDLLFQLDRLEPVPPDEGGLDNGYTCTCTCTYPEGGVSVLPLDVCMAPELNPNITHGDPPDALELAADCGGHVEGQLAEMTDECWDGQDPTCDCVVDPTPVTFFDEDCDLGCPEISIDGTCSNWDPETGTGTATCADPVDCDNFGPVCLRSVDPSQPGPTPLAARVLGRTTTCDVTSGDLTLGLDGDTESTGLDGTVSFTPATGCAPGATCLSMDYRLGGVGTISFGGIPILGIGDTDITGVVTAGGTEPFALGVSSTSFLAPDAVGVSGRAFENGDRQAAIGTNAEPLVVTFDGDTCSVQGNLAGRAGDPDGDSGDATVHVFASGVVTNTPPVAAVSAPATVECTSAAGAEVVLDATPSTDRESDLVSYGWYRGSRVGPVVGLAPVLVAQQALGAETYVLKLIDSGMQADELAVTVSVVDTTAPTLDCGAPATITPNGTPYRFPATTADACDDALGAAEILDYACFAINGAGHRVDKACKVEIDGSTLVVDSSTGVGTEVEWTVRSTDGSGNTASTTCETVVVVPGQQ